MFPNPAIYTFCEDSRLADVFIFKYFYCKYSAQIMSIDMSIRIKEKQGCSYLRKKERYADFFRQAIDPEWQAGQDQICCNNSHDNNYNNYNNYYIDIRELFRHLIDALEIAHDLCQSDWRGQSKCGKNGLVGGTIQSVTTQRFSLEKCGHKWWFDFFHSKQEKWSGLSKSQIAPVLRTDPWWLMDRSTSEMG